MYRYRYRYMYIDIYRDTEIYIYIYIQMSVRRLALTPASGILDLVPLTKCFRLATTPLS